jgi:hypothetical protein
LLSRDATKSRGFWEVKDLVHLPGLARKSFNIPKKHQYPLEYPISTKKAGVKNVPSTKVDMNHNKIARIQCLDELAGILFPGNRNHQRIFLAIFIELKYAPDQFLPVLSPLCDKYGFSPRMLETVRSKMRRMGLIDHVSRFNKAYGYREGWVFSHRLSRSLTRLAELVQGFEKKKDSLQERKDRDLFLYV